MAHFGWNRPVVAVLGAAFALVTLAGCSGGGDDEKPSVVGSWGSTETGQANLELTEAGTATGSDGCNQLTGSWEEVGHAAEFSPWSSTQMACEGVDPWLGKSTSAKVDGDQLVFYDDGGTKLGALDKAS